MQNLEYEQKEAKRQVGENGDMDLQKACHNGNRNMHCDRDPECGSGAPETPSQGVTCTPSSSST